MINNIFLVLGIAGVLAIAVFIFNQNSRPSQGTKDGFGIIAFLIVVVLLILYFVSNPVHSLR